VADNAACDCAERGTCACAWFCGWQLVNAAAVDTAAIAVMIFFMVFF
jgi:hypothetical protein